MVLCAAHKTFLPIETEDFAGDILGYIPELDVPAANIITFGPFGAGKVYYD